MMSSASCKGRTRSRVFTVEVGYGDDRRDEELLAPAPWPADLRGRDGRDGVKRWTSPRTTRRGSRFSFEMSNWPNVGQVT
jgi:hypothetical protein